MEKKMIEKAFYILVHFDCPKWRTADITFKYALI